VLADREVGAALASRVTLPPHQAARVMVPYTYDASTARERVEEDVAIRERTAIGNDAFNAQYQAIRSWPGTIDRLGALTMPVLVIHGETDRLVPPENGQILARAIPHSKLVMIPNASHIFFTDQPEASRAAILSFLAS
jgi:pimeloyl-ACP methyl ester carboxylesterase